MHENPAYDPLYQTIVEEIDNYEKQEKHPAVLSWLTTNQDKHNAIAARKTIPSISNLGDPFELNDLKREQVNYEFFSEFYRDQLNPKKESELGETSRKSVCGIL